VRLFPVEIDRSGTELIFFGALGTQTGLPPWLTLPVLFLGVAGVMMLIGEGVARTFRQFPPLDAYRLDILGSLAGIIAFSVLSFLGAPPVAWGAVVAVALFLLVDRRTRTWQLPVLGVMLLLLGVESLVPTDSWSPYYKVRLIRQPSGAVTLLVNGIPHQTMEPAARRLATVPLYGLVYQRTRTTPTRLLIVGAGTGVDVAVALREGVQHIDAVEIDPRIHAIGLQQNPDRAFQDPRVTSYVNDGRAFLEQTTGRYDLILFRPARLADAGRRAVVPSTRELPVYDRGDAGRAGPPRPGRRLWRIQLLPRELAGRPARRYPPTGLRAPAMPRLNRQLRPARPPDGQHECRWSAMPHHLASR